VAGVVVVVVVLVLTGLVIAWRRRHAPVPIGEGIRALGRISQYDNMPEVVSRPHRAARRRRQVRLASTLCLSVLGVVWTASSYRRGWAVAFGCVLLLRVLFEMLARRPQDP
jgi:hypothetical protein